MKPALDNAAVAQAASLLIDARTTRTPLDRLPESCRPATATDALRIQAAIVARSGERIAGWKVGSVVDGIVSYGVLLATRVVATGSRVAARDVPLLGMEAEIAFRFIGDAPPRERAYSYEEVADRVVALPAIEVVATRYRDYATTPVVERMADCMSNGAFVAGRERDDWRSFDLAKLAVSLQFDEDVIVERTGGHAAGDPLLPALALVNDLRSSSGVTAGQLMTTGTYTGLNYAKPGQRVRATFEGFGSAEVLVGA